MNTRRMMLGWFIAISAAAVMPALAQTTAGAGTVVVLPTVAYIPGAYTTTVFVRNPNSNPVTLSVLYYQSDSASPPGDGSPLTCTPLTVGANLAVQFDLSAQCTFVSSDNFGQLLLVDSTGTYKTNRFYAYSRSQESNGNGFSVEGFPVGNFSGASSDVLGLQRTAAAPHYRSNCFVGALAEPVDYQIILRQGETGAVLGGAISGTLDAYHTVRILDVFGPTGADVPGSADLQNVRATFSTSTANSPAYIGFCTLETSDNGSADFRVAKSESANDNRQSRLACYGMDSCGASLPSITNPAQITGAGTKNIHYAIFDQPDFVKCDLVSNDLADLQMTLRGPGDPLTSPQFALPAGYDTPPYTSGGSGQTGFYVYTGEKSMIDSGSTTRWYIDVSFRGGGDAGNLPIAYGIKCTSGNGITVPWLGTTAPTP